MTSQSQNSNQPNTDPEKEGLPDISQKTKQNPLLAGIVLLIIIVAGFFISHSYTHKDKEDENTNENFSVNSSLKLNSPEQPPLQPQTKVQAQETNQISSETAQQIQKQQLIAQKALIARLQAPMMIVKSNENTNNVSDEDKLNNETNANHVNPNTAFLNQAASQKVETKQATVLHNRASLIAQGNLIQATLESAINSDLPGMLRAVVSQPVYSEDGSTVLIHRGSRLIGEYKSGIETGQTRIFVVWTRVIEPNGVSVQLGSPGVDSLGVAGFGADNVDNHFWKMFGTASLLSVIGAGASNVGVNSIDQYNASQMYRQALSQSFAQSANNALQKNASVPPTLHKDQGATVIVFVAKDLDFTKAMKREGRGMEVF
jgi:type IV secretion system protein VirB10